VEVLWLKTSKTLCLRRQASRLTKQVLPIVGSPNPECVKGVEGHIANQCDHLIAYSAREDGVTALNDTLTSHDLEAPAGVRGDIYR
jgi:hypothetical protein